MNVYRQLIDEMIDYVEDNEPMNFASDASFGR